MTFKLCNNSQVRNFKQLTERLKKTQDEYDAVRYTRSRATNDIEYYNNKLISLKEEINTIKERLNRYVVIRYDMYPEYKNVNGVYFYIVNHYNIEENMYNKNELVTNGVYGELLSYYKQFITGSRVRDKHIDEENGYYTAYEYYYRVN